MEMIGMDVVWNGNDWNGMEMSRTMVALVGQHLFFQRNSEVNDWNGKLNEFGIHAMPQCMSEDPTGLKHAPKSVCLLSFSVASSLVLPRSG